MENIRIDVAVRHGRLRGIVKETVYGKHYIAFCGIPYAKPPIGALRFKDAEPAESWPGVKDASKFGNSALQMNIIEHKIIGSEDCLYLNVYTSDIEPMTKRAVMVWIHGGGFVLGSGDDSIYGPDYMIQKNIVLVTLNYRLGVFGFLNLGNEVAAGNQGIKDVIMALRWVQENISNFGGDPGNVTIFGESAGGAIVHCLTMCPLADGLFHKAISQSGVIANPWALSETIKEGFLLAEKFGNQSTDPKIVGELLKTIDAIKLIEIARSIEVELEKIFILLFCPSLDYNSPNPVFRKHPTVMMHLGIKVPFLLGHNNCEGSLFVRLISDKVFQTYNSNFEKTLNPKVMVKFKKQSKLTIEALRYMYFGNKPVSKETLSNYADFVGDIQFCRGVYEVADIQMQLGHAATYLYKFSYDNKISPLKKLIGIDIPGVTHGEDLIYLFHPHILHDFNIEAPKSDSTEYKLINRFTQMWTDFAKTGNPTPTTTDLIPITWKPLQSGSIYNYLNIDNELRMETVRKGEQRFEWSTVKNKL